MMATKIHTKKRILATFMALVMTLSLLPVNVLAGGEPVTVNVGESVTLSGVKESDNGQHEWSVVDGTVASVADGVVTGLKAGTTEVVHTYYVAVPVEELPEELPPEEQLPPEEELPPDGTETGDAETGETETGETETGDAETGETETGDAETGETESGDAETGDAETGETETGDAETGETETGETETGETETGETETGNTETGNTESGNTESGNTESSNTESGNTESGNTESSNTETGSSDGGMTAALMYESEGPEDAAEPAEEPAPETQPETDGDAVVEEPQVTYEARTQTWTVEVVDVEPMITGSATYDDVTVDVSAPESAFPQGTTLSITPIKEEMSFGDKILSFFEHLFDNAEEAAQQDMEPLEAVRQVLTDTVADVEADAPLVAFDISFYDADGGKVQPEGDTVNVTFSVDSGSSLLNGEAAQLQVYHLEESEDGTETEVQPVGEAVTVEAGEDAEVSVEADSFSIYVVSAVGSTSTAQPLDDMTLTVGETVTVHSDKGTSRYYSWSSSNTNVATVQQESSRRDYATITAKSAGKTTISYGYGYGDDKATITVVEAGVSIENTIWENGGLTVTAVDGVDLEGATYQWYISDSQNGSYQTVEAYEKAADDYCGFVPCSDDAPNTLFVARAGAQKWFKVTVTLSDGTEITSAAFLVDYYDELQNGSFETPNILNGQYTSFDNHSYFTQISHDTPNLYWKTTKWGKGWSGQFDDGYNIELVRIPSWQSTTTYGVHNAAQGYQFAELNCEVAGALYQDVLTVPGSTLYWGLEHADRNNQNGDTMLVVISDTKDLSDGWDPTNAEDLADRPEDIQATLTSKNTAWNYHQGQYVVPEGQYVTRFYFVSANGSTQGNLLDNISFGKDLPNPPAEKGNLQIEKTVTGLESGTVIPAESFIFTITDGSSNQQTVKLPATDTKVSGTSVTLTGGLSSLTPGEYTVSESFYAQTIGDFAYTTTGSSNAQRNVTVPEGNTATASFINAYQITSTDYSFTKTWNGTPASFRVTLTDNSDKHYSALTVNVSADGTATVSDSRYTATVDKATNTKNWTIEVQDLPGDSDYHVTAETQVGDKTVTGSTATVDGNNWWIVSISGDSVTNTHHRKAENQANGTLYIYKTGENNQPLADVTFRLQGGSYNQTAITDSSGVAKFENIPVSTTAYTLSEESAPAEYTLKTETWSVKVEKVPGTDVTSSDFDGGTLHTYNHTAKVTVGSQEITESNKLSITNSKVSGKISITKDVDPEAAQASQYVFDVKNGNKTVATLTVNAENSWTAKTTDLPAGTYTITERDPGDNGDYNWSGVSYSGANSSSGNSATVTIGRSNNGQTITVTATNSYAKKTDGVLTITKRVTGGAPSDAEFAFTVKIGGSNYSGSYTVSGTGAPSGQQTATNGVITLKANQTATITGLTRGVSYEVTETGVMVNGSANQSALTDSYTTTISGSGTYSVLKASGTISGTTSAVTYINEYVTKGFTITKQDAETPYGLLDGAVFTLTGGSQLYTTQKVPGQQGKLQFTGIPVGTYTMQETQAPNGYVLDDTTWTVTVTKDGVTVVENENETEETALQAILNTLKGLFRSNENLLVNGNMVVTNTHKKANIVVSKTVTGDYTPTSDETFTFGLYTKNGDTYEPVQKDSAAWTIEVAKDGSNSFTGLTTGQTYYVAEISEGRTNYDWTVTYNVPAGNIETKDGVTYVKVIPTLESTADVNLSCTNDYDRQTGTLTVGKAVTYGTTVPGNKHLPSGTAYTFVIEGPTEVSGTYGGVTFTNGTSGAFTLTDGGSKTFEDLPTGSYTLKEMNPATGNLLLSVSAVVNSSDDSISMDETSGTYVLPAQTLADGATMTIAVTNHYELGSDHNRAVFQVKKTDATSNAIITTGAEFTLYSNSACTTPVGDPVTTGRDGLALFTLEQAVLGAYAETGTATFYLKETKAPTGYQENTSDVWTVTVTKEGGSYSAEVELAQSDNLFHRIWNWVVSKVTGWSDEGGKPTLTVPNERDVNEEPVIENAKIYLLKVDGANETKTLSDAVFTLTNVNDSTDTITTAASGSDGVITVTFDNTNMTSDGEKVYAITETTPPTGYQAAKGILGYVKVTRTSNTELEGDKFVTTITYTAGIYTDQTCTNLANLTGRKLVVENDQLVDVSVSKAWQDAAGSTISAPANASVQFTLFYKAKGSSDAYAQATDTITDTPTITLRGSNWTATWTGLSPDYDYQVKETQGYTDYTAQNGGIASNGGTITNKRDSNSLTITKTVTKDPANLPVTIPNDTTFTVYHADGTKYTEFTYNQMTDTVDNKPAKVLENVPTGEYYVVETGADVTYYKLTVTGAYKDEKSSTVAANTATVTSSQAARIDISNKYEREDGWDSKTSLTIVKNVAGLDDETLSRGKTYYFSITGKDVYNQDVTKYATITLPDDDGETVQLPISNSSGYTVTELNAEKGTAVSTTNKPVAIANYEWSNVSFKVTKDGTTTDNSSTVALTEKDASATVTATNTYTRLTTPEDAGLTITKTVTVETGVTVPDDTFTFIVKADGELYTGSYTVDGKTKQAGDDGIITLKDGDTATIGSIDYGTTFTITETVPGGYTLESVAGGTVNNNSTTVTIDETNKTADVTFTNRYVTRGFDIQKVDKDDAQTRLPGAVFTVYTYDEANGSKGAKVMDTAATDTNGKTSVSDLPVGTYWMGETTAPENYVLSDDAWIIRVTTSDITVEDANPSVVGQLISFLSGSDLLDSNDTLTVNNTATEYQLTITKTVTGIDPVDQSGFEKQYFFNVYQGEKKLNAVAFTVNVSYDAATQTITGSTTISSEDYSWLKAGAYEVREDTALADTEHYRLETANSTLTQDVTLTHDQTKATITVEADDLTNAYTHRTGTLEITKIVSGLVGKDAREDHTYQIQLTAKGGSNTTYELTVSGNGTVTWADAQTQSKTITLPTGNYQVKELNGPLGNPYGLTTTYQFTQNGQDVTGLEIKDGQLSTLTVTNTYNYNPPAPEEMEGEISGTKVWNDGNDADGLRPDSIRVQLFYGGDAIDGAYTDVTGGDFTIAYDSYFYDQEKLVSFKEVGYTVDGKYTAFDENHDSVPGYEAPAYEGSTITNTHHYATVDITVEKEWSAKAYSRQRAVTLHLLADGRVISDFVLDGTAGGVETEAWKATFQDLPRSSGGDPIEYTVTEDSLGSNWSYRTSVTATEGDDGVEAYYILVTNRYDDGDDGDGGRDPEGPTNIPDEDTPTTDLPDEDTPTTDLPDEETPTTDLPDEDVPQADVPSTGDNLIAWVLAAAVSGVGLVWLAISGKKRKDEQGE